MIVKPGFSSTLTRTVPRGMICISCYILFNTCNHCKIKPFFKIKIFKLSNFNQWQGISLIYMYVYWKLQCVHSAYTMDTMLHWPRDNTFHFQQFQMASNIKHDSKIELSEMVQLEKMCWLIVILVGTGYTAFSKQTETHSYLKCVPKPLMTTLCGHTDNRQM